MIPAVVVANSKYTNTSHDVRCHIYSPRGLYVPIVIYMDEARRPREKRFFFKSIQSWSLQPRDKFKHATCFKTHSSVVRDGNHGSVNNKLCFHLMGLSGRCLV